MKYILSITLTAFFTISGLAQSRTAYYELGLGAGTMNYAGDIATTTSTNAILEEMRPNFMVYGKKHFNDWFAMGLTSSYGWMYASDANHSNQQRGLSVKTKMFQVNPYLEASLIRFGKYHYDRKFTIFVQAGAGFLAYNPEPEAAEVYPENIEPRPDAYNSINFFVGTGMKFRLTYNSILTLGITYHGSGVDDLDGIKISKGFTSGKNDVYSGVYVGISRAFF